MSNSCPTCGTENRPVARFCKKCATPLAVVAPPAPAALPVFCTACGKPNGAHARFCRSCGTAMTGVAVPVPLSLPPPSQPVPLAADTPPLRPAPATPRRSGLALAALLVLLLAAAVFWWLQQRTVAPLPVAAPPFEEILSDDRPAATSQSAASATQALTAPNPDASVLPTIAPRVALPAAAQPPRPSVSTPSAASTLEPEPVSAAAVEPAPADAEVAPAPVAPRPSPAPAPRQAPARAAPPPPAVAQGPDAACAARSAFTKPFCLSVQCFKGEFRQHPTCVRLSEEARQRRQYERDNNITGG